MGARREQRKRHHRSRKPCRKAFFLSTDQNQNPAKFGLARANPAKSSKEPARSGLAGPIPGVRQPIGAIPGGGPGDGRPGRHGARALPGHEDEAGGARSARPGRSRQDSRSATAGRRGRAVDLEGGRDLTKTDLNSEQIDRRDRSRGGRWASALTGLRRDADQDDEDEATDEGRDLRSGARELADRGQRRRGRSEAAAFELDQRKSKFQIKTRVAACGCPKPGL
jgi:hypothetical protein